MARLYVGTYGKYNDGKEIIMKRTTKEMINARTRGALKMRDLRQKAYDFYSNTDPLTVFAWNDGTFSVVGLINEDFQTIEDLQECFENMYDEINKENQE